MSTGTIGTLRQFVPNQDSWMLYQEQMEMFFSINGIKDEPNNNRKVQALITALSAETYATLRSLCQPSLPSTKTYEELCKFLKTHYSPTTAVYRERIEFFYARQEEGENVNAWYARLHDLAASCEFGSSLQEHLKNIFVCGMRKGSIRDRLCEEKPEAKLEDMLRIALNREASLAASTGINLVRSVNTKNSSKRNDGDKFRKKEYTSNDGKRYCKACGKSHTGSQKCKYIFYTCNTCKNMGHLSKVCPRNKSNIRQNILEAEDSSHVEINNIHFENVKPINVAVSVRDKNFSMQLDTGAGASVISYKLYDKLLTEYEILETDLTLKSFSGCVIKPLGCIKVDLTYKEKTVNNFPFYVVKCDNQTQDLLGRDFLCMFNFKLSTDILTVNETLDSLLNEFKDLFDGVLGCYKYETFSLQLKENFRPVFMKSRPVPIAFRENIDKELDKLIADNVIIPIQASKWATPLVPVLKQDGGIRLCADYKITANKYLADFKYPLPGVEEIFAQLSEGKAFTKIDLSNAYNQLKLDDQSAEIVTWNTHRGLFRVLRLPFGITPASAIFQRVVENLVKGIPNVANFLDDIIVTGRTKEEHLNTLRLVFAKLRDAGLKINRQKCKFFEEEIRYLGHTISKNGLKKNSDKVNAIINAPEPINKIQVQSFAGLVNYYRRFVPNLSIIMKPIYELLKKDYKFVWTRACSEAFNQIKKIIASDNILMHFNPRLPIILATDASADGISAALMHKLNNGDMRPVAFASRTLMPAEKNYSVIDRESLAIYWGAKKFAQYLMGHSFIIKTDHKPLVSIFGEARGLPQMAASRLQRWALYLSGFSYKIEYVKGVDNHLADMLSRHPIQVNYISNDYSNSCTYLNMLMAEGVPVDHVKISIETRRDPVLAVVYNYVSSGWPEQVRQDEVVPFFRRKEELTLEQGCIMWGFRVVVPNKFRAELLAELHSSHLGSSKMKSVARSYFWWPGLDSQIENMAKSCKSCLLTSNDANKAPLIPWARPTKRWQRIHVDYLGPLNGEYFLVVIDAFSKWPEIFRTKNCTSDTTIIKLRETFTRWGIPESLVSDNGTCFKSEAFEHFLKHNGIKHKCTAPYHPATNGAAENAVKSFKKGFKAALVDPRNKHVSTDIILARYLLNYRNAIHCTTNESPASLMLGRSLRTLFDLVRPNTESIAENRAGIQGKHFKGKSKTYYNVGDSVVVRDYRNNVKSWIEAEIIELLGPRSFMCKLKDGTVWKRHYDQIKLAGSVNIDRNGNTAGSSDRVEIPNAPAKIVSKFTKVVAFPNKPDDNEGDRQNVIENQRPNVDNASDNESSNSPPESVSDDVLSRSEQGVSDVSFQPSEATSDSTMESGQDSIGQRLRSTRNIKKPLRFRE